MNPAAAASTGKPGRTAPAMRRRCSGRRLPSAIPARVAVIVATALYAASLYYAYRVYLEPQWGYLGFSFRPPDGFEVLAIVVLLAGGAMVVPTRLTRPSATVLMFLYIIVYVPSILISFCVDADRMPRYLPYTFAMLAALATASWASARSTPVHRQQCEATVVPGPAILAGFLVAWIAMSLILVATYRDVMTLVALDDVYGQRAAGASTGALNAYIQTYYAGVVNPGLLAIGLRYRRPGAIVLGVVGSVLMYTVNAQKTVLLLPLLMVAVHVQLSSRVPALRTIAAPLTVFAVVTVIAVAQWEDNLVAGALALFLVGRTLAMPGLTFSQYFDQFDTQGFTFWSHIRGFDLVIPAPAAYAGDPLWPGLGYMLGDRLFGMPEFNMNANLFASDGIAAAGAAGVLVVGVALAAYLYALDRVSSRWDRRFSQLAVLPIGVALTNGQLSTTLLSFGGFFWLLFFAFLGRSTRRRVRSSRRRLVPGPT